MTQEESDAYEQWLKDRNRDPNAWNRGELGREAFAAGALWERHRKQQPPKQEKHP